MAKDETVDGTFHCETCNQTLSDSNAWFDHLNSKKHNTLKGMSLKVEKSSIEKVKAKLAGLKRKGE